MYISAHPFSRINCEQVKQPTNVSQRIRLVTGPIILRDSSQFKCPKVQYKHLRKTRGLLKLESFPTSHLIPSLHICSTTTATHGKSQHTKKNGRIFHHPCHPRTFPGESSPPVKTTRRPIKLIHCNQMLLPGKSPHGMPRPVRS